MSIKPKKVFMYIHSLHRGAGAENVMFQICKLLKENKYQITVCGMVDEFPSFEDEYNKINIPVLRLSMDRNGRIGKFLKLIKLFNILRKEKPDIFMAWLRPAILTGGVLAKWSGIKKRVANLRGPALNKSFSKVLLDRIFSRNYTDYIAVSESVKEIFSKREKFPIDKIEVINNGLDIKNIQIKQETKELKAKLGLQNELIIGTIGRLYPEKNQKLMLSTAKILKEKNINFKMLLVGDGPNENTLKKMMKELAVEDKVIFTGWQSNVLKYISIFDIFVLPSLYEGHPSAILQAWLMNKPVLATKVIGIKDIVIDGYNGFLFDKNMPDELSNLIINLKKNPAIMQKISIAGLETVKYKYTLEKMNKNYLDFFKYLLISR